MRVSDEAVEAAASTIYGDLQTPNTWEEAPRSVKLVYRALLHTALQAALPHLTPNPWVDASTIHTADGRTFIGTDADGYIAMVRPLWHPKGVGWRMDDGSTDWMPTRVMPLLALPEDTGAGADPRASHMRDIRETDR